VKRRHTRPRHLPGSVLPPLSPWRSCLRPCKRERQRETDVGREGAREREASGTDLASQHAADAHRCPNMFGKPTTPVLNRHNLMRSVSDGVHQRNRGRSVGLQNAGRRARWMKRCLHHTQLPPHLCTPHPDVSAYTIGVAQRAPATPCRSEPSTPGCRRCRPGSRGRRPRRRRWSPSCPLFCLLTRQSTGGRRRRVAVGVRGCSQPSNTKHAASYRSLAGAACQTAPGTEAGVFTQRATGEEGLGTQGARDRRRPSLHANVVSGRDTEPLLERIDF